MISKKLAKAINDQINAEMWSAYLYLSMSQDIYAKGYKGIAHWYKVQFLEEQAHAAIMINYMLGSSTNRWKKKRMPATWYVKPR